MNVFLLRKKISIKKIITILLLGFISAIPCNKEEVFENYNFVDKQNFEIDLNHNQIKGNNLYFNSDDNLTLYFVTIFPDISLSVDMKLYTNNTDLISAIDNLNSIFFGFDFNITNLDIQFPNYRSDIFVCNFSMNNTKCTDYIFDLTDSKYKNNQNGKIIKSKISNFINLDNLIPFGFNITKKNILRENIINYIAYYEVRFEKKYPKNFDNTTMFKWIDFRADALKENITVFYGIYDKNFEEEFSINDLYYSKTVIFRDGVGLSNFSKFLNYSNLVIYIYMIIVCFIY